MLKLILFTVGLAGGAGGATAWLLSEPGPSQAAALDIPERLNELKQRLNRAMAEGAKAGEETENRIRHEFDSYRRHPERPGTSS